MRPVAIRHDHAGDADLWRRHSGRHPVAVEPSLPSVLPDVCQAANGGVRCSPAAPDWVLNRPPLRTPHEQHESGGHRAASGQVPRVGRRSGRVGAGRCDLATFDHVGGVCEVGQQGRVGFGDNEREARGVLT